MPIFCGKWHVAFLGVTRCADALSSPASPWSSQSLLSVARQQVHAAATTVTVTGTADVAVATATVTTPGQLTLTTTRRQCTMRGRPMSVIGDGAMLQELTTAGAVLVGGAGSSVTTAEQLIVLVHMPTSKPARGLLRSCGDLGRCRLPATSC